MPEDFESPERDNSTFRIGQVLRSPRSIAAALLFLTTLVVLRIFLRAAIRLNAVTFGSYEFHCWAMEFFHKTSMLVDMRDVR
jgi:hypothetical protein